MKEPIIVADIGGTNGRFGIAHFGNGDIQLERTMTYSNENLAGFADLLSQYLDDLGDDAPKHACFATAGPNNGREGLLTNLGWQLDATSLEAQFGLDEILFVNDFRALARMAPELLQSDTVLVRAADGQADAPVSVIGPGTGLGVALVLDEPDGPVTVGTEGGHMGFAPGNALEVALWQHLSERHEFVYAELLLSGDGLCRMHDFLVAEHGDGSAGLSAANITEAALAGDASCERTVMLFLAILGSVAGDVALCHGARGGVYLGGGILRRVIPLLERSEFSGRFLAKGRMRDYLAEIPVRLITAEQVARRGAARLFQQHRMR